MKIRLLIDAKLIGGTETHVLNLCQGLIARKYDCQIVFIRDYPNNPLYAQCDARGLPYTKSKHYSDLIKLLRVEQPDIIHTHGYKANIISRLLRLFCKCKLVATYHAGEPPVGRLILYNFLDRWSSHLSHNIAVNAQIAAQLPSTADIIPNFVDMPKQKNQIKKNGPYTVYFIGRFSPEKDPLSFCQLAKMPSTDIRWHAVGTGPLLKECEKQAGNDVHFHGAITNMNDTWPKVDLLCITSTYEGLPLVLLEAMSRGIPVVSFDVGSIKTTLLNDPYIITPYDLTHMHNCILSHFSKPITSRALMAINARQHIQEHYSSDAIIPQIEALYRRCLHDTQ
jgi:glycosyltransferase involved in cell wall biosynthesis